MYDLRQHIAELQALAETQEGQDRERTEDHIHDLQNDLREQENEQAFRTTEEAAYVVSGPFLDTRILSEQELD